MMRWEYLTGVVDNYVDPGKGYVFIACIIQDGSRVKFSELGDRGWELVEIKGETVYFKRPLTGKIDND